MPILRKSIWLLSVIFSYMSSFFLSLAFFTFIIFQNTFGYLATFPLYDVSDLPNMTRVYAVDGSILAEYSRERRLYLPIQSIPDLLKNAFVIAEDPTFYETFIDVDKALCQFTGILCKTGHERNSLLSPITRYVVRPIPYGFECSGHNFIRQLFVGIRIEATLSKDHILELYLNQIYLGMGSYGVAAASLVYFNKPTNELTLAEMAYLAALPKAPSHYNPFRKNKEAVIRRNWVIDRMLAKGSVTIDEAEKAKTQPLVVAARRVSPKISE